MMDGLIVVVAGMLGGALNAVAGGGSFITLPALILVGVPPLAANATGTAALLPGYIASAWRFRRDIEFPAGLGAASMAFIAIAGGCLGASILLLTGEHLFSALIPWLILLATAMFVIGPRLPGQRDRSSKRTAQVNDGLPGRKMAALVVLFMVCVYGGYFNGGLGIIVLAALALLGQSNMHGMNGVKNVMSALLTTVAVTVYSVGGVIDSRFLWLLGGAAVVGGYGGAALAYRIDQRLLRAFIVCVGLGMSLWFFVA